MNREPLIKLISVIYRYSLMYANRKLENFDITGGELSFFIAIVDKEGITQEELSGYLKMNKSTTSKAVKLLESKGYVVKKIYDKDRRSYNLYPTKKAIELRKQMRKLAFGWDDILLEGIDKKERESIYKAVETMVENADRYLSRRTDNE